MDILYKAARPKTSIYIEKAKGEEGIYVKPSSGLHFPGVDNIREQVNRAVISTDASLPVTLDFSHVSTLDYTSIRGINLLSKDMKKQNQSLTFVNINKKLEKKLNENCEK